MLWTSWASHYQRLFSGGGDDRLACQPAILPSSRQTKGMDGSQTECLNLARIKGLNGKLQSTRENFNELRSWQVIEKDNSGRFARRRLSNQKKTCRKLFTCLHHPSHLLWSINQCISLSINLSIYLSINLFHCLFTLLGEGKIEILAAVCNQFEPVFSRSHTHLFWSFLFWYI